MKRKTITILGVLSALLLLSVAAVYAHGNTQGYRERYDYMMMDYEEMDEMHDWMTKGLDPELKDQMDILHDGCTPHFEGQEYGVEDDMMRGRSFYGMMGMVGMI